MNTKSAIVVVVMGLIASAASADFMRYDGVGLKEIVGIHSPGAMSDNASVYAGQELLTYKGAAWTAYCVDINHWSASGEVAETTTASLHNGNVVAYLLDTYATAATTNLKAAALGVAIWEAVFEYSGTFNTGIGSENLGSFYVTDNNEVAAEANAMLAGWTGQPTSQYKVLQGNGIQAFAVVPEPATMVLLGLGAVGAMIRRRK